MPEFEHEERGVRFVIPDRPTVEDQLRWFGLVASVTGTQNQFLNYWSAIVPMIEEWECDGFHYETPLDKVDDPKVTQIVMWAGSKVLAFMNDLDSVPKKSNATGSGNSKGAG